MDALNIKGIPNSTKDVKTKIWKKKTARCWFIKKVRHE